MKNRTPGTGFTGWNWLGPSALLFLLAGWVVSVLLAGGLELHRSAVAVPLVMIGALLGLMESVRSGRVARRSLLLAGLPLLLYFIYRALSSQVWDLGRHDLHLITMAWLTIVTVSTCGATRRARGIILFVLVTVFGVQFLAGLYQQFIDPGFTFFHRARPSAEGVSGLFWQWNNLAGLLAIMVPLFLGVGLYGRGWRSRLPFLLLVIAGLLLSWLTKSRAGFAAAVCGVACCCALYIFLRIRRQGPGARVGAYAGLAALVLLVAGAVALAIPALSEQRGQESNLGNLMGSSSRLGLAGVAFDIWQQNPLFGNGSQSYRYLSIQHWDGGIPGWVNDPELAHSEYLQVLCDYGLVGLVLLLGFLVVILLGALLPVYRDDGGAHDSSLWRGLQVGGAAALVGGMLHGAFDFQTHLLPILMMAALVIGLIMPAGPPTRSLFARGGYAALVMVVVALSIIAVGKESLRMTKWLNWEKSRQTSYEVGSGELPLLRTLVEESPHYAVAEMYGRLQLSAYTQTPEADRPEIVVRLAEARWALELALERHPEDARTLIVLALVLDLLGDFDEAAEIHGEAIRVARRRERKFGAYAGLSHHLALRGKHLWYNRRPEEAFGCFLRSLEYLEYSIRDRGYRFSQPQEFRERRAILEFYIKSLQDGKIRPEFPPDILNRFFHPDVLNNS